MPSRSRWSPSLFLTLLRKELTELLASPAAWLLLVMVGPLVGHAFLTAVNAYAEMSGLGGGPSALAQGLSPLDGILVPTFGAYDLLATLLFPFLPIRLIAAEKANGGLQLLLQTPAPLPLALLAKGVALLAGYLAACAAGVLAMGLWAAYGGHLHAPETLNLLLGHLLRVFLSAGVAVAAASVCESAASAAIVTLGFTVGTWALDFLAAGRGGALEKVGRLTPTALLRVFEHGELRLSGALIAVLFALAGFVLAAIWLPPGVTLRTKTLRSAALSLSVAALTVVASFVRTSWDLSEDRRGSFSRPDEAALHSLAKPVRIAVHLAPEDPRLNDLTRGVLDKLARVLPDVRVDHVASSQTGLFEGDHYGEVWYDVGGRRGMTRSTTVPIVLELLYGLADIKPPDASREPAFPGYPLAARPRGAALLFFGLWPTAAGLAFLVNRRRWRRR